MSYGWGAFPRTLRIGASEFTTSLFPKDGGYLVPIKDAVRKAEGLVLGDGLQVEMEIRSRLAALDALVRFPPAVPSQPAIGCNPASGPSALGTTNSGSGSGPASRAASSASSCATSAGMPTQRRAIGRADHLHQRHLPLRLRRREAHVDRRARGGRLQLDGVEHLQRARQASPGSSGR